MLSSRAQMLYWIRLVRTPRIDATNIDWKSIEHILFLAKYVFVERRFGSDIHMLVECCGRPH